MKLTVNFITKSLHINPNDEYHGGEVPKSIGVCQQYKRTTMNGICISVGLATTVFFKEMKWQWCVHNIAVKNSAILLLYQKFHERTDFSNYPLPSSHLGIYKVPINAAKFWLESCLISHRKMWCFHLVLVMWLFPSPQAKILSDKKSIVNKCSSKQVFYKFVNFVWTLMNL